MPGSGSEVDSPACLPTPGQSSPLPSALLGEVPLAGTGRKGSGLGYRPAGVHSRLSLSPTPGTETPSLRSLDLAGPRVHQGPTTQLKRGHGLQRLTRTVTTPRSCTSVISSQMAEPGDPGWGPWLRHHEQEAFSGPLGTLRGARWLEDGAERGRRRCCKGILRPREAEVVASCFPGL